MGMRLFTVMVIKALVLFNDMTQELRCLRCIQHRCSCESENSESDKHNTNHGLNITSGPEGLQFNIFARRIDSINSLYFLSLFV